VRLSLLDGAPHLTARVAALWVQCGFAIVREAVPRMRVLMRDLRDAEQQLPLLPVATKPATTPGACAAHPWCRRSVGGWRQTDVWRAIAGRGAVALWLLGFFSSVEGGPERLRLQCVSGRRWCSSVVGHRQPSSQSCLAARQILLLSPTTRHCDLSTRDCCNHRSPSATPLTTLPSSLPSALGT
jgi:hypothetical protein